MTQKSCFSTHRNCTVRGTPYHLSNLLWLLLYQTFCCTAEKIWSSKWTSQDSWRLHGTALSGLVVECLPWEWEVMGLNPGWVTPKAWHSASEGFTFGVRSPMIRGPAAAHRSLGGWVKILLDAVTYKGLLSFRRDTPHNDIIKTFINVTKYPWYNATTQQLAERTEA